MLSAIDRPEDVGLSSSRLPLLHDHLARNYVGTRYPGTLLLVSRGGQIAYLDAQGYSPDALFRIYSMTKAITSVALMTLYEEGRFQLDDPVSRFIPAWRDLRVWDGGSADAWRTRLPSREMQIRDLLSHTSGLSYAFLADHPLAEVYKRRDIAPGPACPKTLAEQADLLAELPLLFDPGSRWSYSIATDICGHLVEVMSGQTLDVFFAERIFSPVGMIDSGFTVRPDQAARLVPLFARGSRDRLMVPLGDPSDDPLHQVPVNRSGGGGLVSTMADYHQFTQMLAGGGTLDGVRVLGRKTLAHMTMNQLAGGSDLAGMGQKAFSETNMEGIGFGLGFAVALDPAAAGVVCSPGEFAWGGAASTYFWIDPVEDLTCIFMTQLLPSSAWPIRRELRSLVYQALI
jgi:CubicO group peptidase (beta-lactamase class C family)